MAHKGSFRLFPTPFISHPELLVWPCPALLDTLILWPCHAATHSGPCTLLSPPQTPAMLPLLLCLANFYFFRLHGPLGCCSCHHPPGVRVDAPPNAHTAPWIPDSGDVETNKSALPSG